MRHWDTGPVLRRSNKYGVWVAYEMACAPPKREQNEYFSNHTKFFLKMTQTKLYSCIVSILQFFPFIRILVLANVIMKFLSKVVICVYFMANPRNDTAPLLTKIFIIARDYFIYSKVVDLNHYLPSSHPCEKFPSALKGSRAVWDSICGTVQQFF